MGQARAQNLVMFGALGAGFIILAAVQAWLAPAQGWWNDEVYSLWASDPRASDVWGHVASDSNPPLYFVLLRLVRTFFAAPHIAVPLANLIVLIGAGGLALWTSRAVGWLKWGALAFAAFVVNGVVAFMFQEARAFLLGASIIFVVAWQCMLLVAVADAPRRPIMLGVLGALAALTHFYAALAAGALAAGLLGWALLARRRDVAAPALILGVTAVLVFGAWYAYASERVANIAWINFSFGAVRDALWYVRSLEIGPTWMALPLAVILGFAAWKTLAVRSSLAVLAIALGVFFVAPVLISIKTPIIMGRYWTIGAALIPIALVLIARACLAEPTLRGGKLAAGAAAAFVLASAAFGAVGARHLMHIEPVWSGAEIVAQRAQACAPGSIRVPDQPHLYATASGVSESTFVAAAALSPRSECPVLGWAEHVLRGDGYSLNAPEAELLGMLGVTAPTEGVTIERHASGFVILRAGS